MSRGRHAGQGSTWFRNRRVSRRLNAESRGADPRDLGTRIDLEKLLGERVEDYPEYDLDAVIEERSKGLK